MSDRNGKLKAGAVERTEQGRQTGFKGKAAPVGSHGKSGSRLRIWVGVVALALLLAVWHLTDVGNGVRASGDRWLYGWYGGLMVWAAAMLGVLGYGIFIKRTWSLELIFTGAVLGLGLMYLVVLPPLSAPDEVSHYITSYQLANRMMGKPNHEDGIRVYIREQDRFIEDLKDVLKPDGSGYRDREEVQPSGENKERKQAVILGQELTEDTYRTIHERGIRSTGENGRAVSYQIPVRTTPLAYVPQALGLIAGQLLGLGGLGLLYMGRLFNLLFFTAVGCLTVRRLPFGKEVFCGVALLPMTLHLASSFSYDVLLIALCSYFTAVCLDLAYRKKQVGWQDVLILAVIMGVMGPCKMVYGIVAGLCLLIPVKKFGSWKSWVLSAAAVLGTFAVAMVLVNGRTVALYTNPASGYAGYVDWAEAPGYTFGQLIRTPLLVLKLCYNTLMWQGEQLYSGMIGGALGNMDHVLNTPYVVILGLTAILVMLSLRKPGEPLFISMKGRGWIWLLGFSCLGALMFSMLLAWTPVGSSVINGVQGRYLLPILPMLLLTLKNDHVVRTDWNDGTLLYVMIGLDVYVALRIFSIVCLRVS